MSQPYQDPNLRQPDPGTFGAADMGASAVQPPATEADESYQRYREEQRSLGEIASDVLNNTSTLIRQEVALAKAEVSQSASRAGKGVGLLAAAGVTAFLALIALTWALCWAFSNLTGSTFWGGVITMVIWLIVAAILGVMGKGEFDKIKGLQQTQDTVKKIPNAVAGNEEKNR